MCKPDRIAKIHQEATTTGSGKLTGREFAFIESIYTQSQRAGFSGLSEKQAAWFSAIACKLEATKGKLAVQIIAEKNRGRLQRQRNSYYAASIGW